MAKSTLPKSQADFDRLRKAPATLIELTRVEAAELSRRLRTLPATWERDALLQALAERSEGFAPMFALPFDDADLALCRRAGVILGGKES